MLTLYKALVVLLGVAALVFVVAKPIFCRFMDPRDYAIRRNLWLGITLSAFLVPNYWLYLMVAGVLVWFAASRDSNPVALYMFLLITLPPMGMDMPTFGIVNQLIFLDHLRFLALMLLLPLALGFFRRIPPDIGGAGRDSVLLLTDVLILFYLFLQTVLLMPYESVTATGKRMLLMGTDVLLPYYVLSRLCRTRESFREIMAAFVLAALVLVPLGVFEVLRSWVLYAGLEDHLGTPHAFGFLTRGNYLRAQVNSGHSIVLGYSFAVAFGCWLALQTWIPSARWRWGILLSFVAGLAVTFARGPWVGAAIIWAVFLCLGPDTLRRAAKGVGLALIVGILAWVSPWGSAIVDNLPFIGNVGSETVEYRQRLAETSWRLILQNPIFGSRDYLASMEDLRQGEGIIDLVNAYASIALSNGLVGLGLFAGFFVTIILRCLLAVRQLATHEPDFSIAGAALVAILVAALVMLSTVNLYMSIGALTWALAGLGIAYVRLARGGQIVSSVEMPLQSGLRSPSRAA